MNVRTLRKGESLPEDLKTGIDSFPTSDPNWIFVVERDSMPVGVLVVAPAHAFVIFLRLVMSPLANPIDIRTLLVDSAAICKERGFTGYVTWLDPNREAEQGLLGILVASGGMSLSSTQVLCAGKI